MAISRQNSSRCQLMDYENTLVLVGHRNAYQFLFLFLMAAAVAFPAMQILSSNFTMVEREMTCKSVALNVSSSTLLKLDNSTHCDVNVDLTQTNGTSFTTAKCVKWTFQRSPMATTVQQTFSLICEAEYLVAVAQTVFMVGFLVGSTCYGMLADRWGRMNALLIAAANVAGFGVIAALTEDIVVYMLFRWMTGFGSAGILAVCYTWHTEMLHCRYRYALSLLMKNGWSLGIFVMTAAAWTTRQWKHTEILLSAPAVGLLMYYAVLVESPRWLLAKGRIREASKAFEKIAKINCKSEDYDDFVEDISLEKGRPVSGSAHVHHLLGTPNMRRVSIIVWINYFTVSMAYYSLSLGWGTIGRGNLFLAMIYGGCVEIASRIVGIICGCFLGRTLIMFASFGIGGVSLLLLIPFYKEDNYETVVVGLALVGRFGLLLACELIWLYSSEVFPTEVRNSAVGLGSTCAQVGAILAPQIILFSKLWNGLHLLILGLLTLLAAFLCLCLPETKSGEYPEFLQDGEEISKNYRVSWFANICGYCCSNSLETDSSKTNVDEEIADMSLMTLTINDQTSHKKDKNFSNSYSDSSFKAGSELSDSSSVSHLATRGSEDQLEEDETSSC